MKHLLVAATVTAAVWLATPAPGEAALVRGTGASDVLFGLDDDNTNDPEIQPEGVAANQSLNNADFIDGLGGHDVMIGLLGATTSSSAGARASAAPVR